MVNAFSSSDSCSCVNAVRWRRRAGVGQCDGAAVPPPPPAPAAAADEGVVLALDLVLEPVPDGAHAPTAPTPPAPAVQTPPEYAPPPEPCGGDSSAENGEDTPTRRAAVVGANWGPAASPLDFLLVEPVNA